MREKIILVGGGGQWQSVIDVIELEGRFEIIGIVDAHKNGIFGYDVIGDDEDLSQIFTTCTNAVVSVGQIKSAEVRIKLFNKLKDIGFNLPIIISPLAYVSCHAVVEEGSVIMHHALVNAGAKVGKCCIVNSKALIEHGAVVGDFSHISTAGVLNGGVVVEKKSFFGSNAVSNNGAIIEGFVKAGSVIK